MNKSKKNNWYNKISNDKILYIFLILQPIIDLITSIMARFTDSSITIGIFTRGLFLVILIAYTLIFTRTKYRKKTIFYFSILALFLLLYFITKIDILKPTFVMHEVINIFKYFYLPIAMICLLNCYEYFKLNKNELQTIFIINVVVLASLIILPSITNTSFSSYSGNNSGSVGWFYAANEIGAVLTLLFPYLYKLGYENKVIKLFIFSMLVVAAMMIIGTKVAFLGMIFTEIVFCLYFFIIRKKITIKPFLVTLFILIISVCVIPLLSVTSNLQNNIDNVNNQIEDNETYKNQQNTSFGKFLRIALSSRDIYLYNTFDIYKVSSFSDKIFGIGFSNRETINNQKIEKLIEIDAFDILFHYGIIGFIIYFGPLLWIYFKSLFKILKKRLKICFYELLYLYAVTLLLGVSCLAGHICGAPAVSIYLIFTFVLLYREVNGENLKKLKEDEVTILALHLGYGGVEQYISSLCKMLEGNYQINIITTYKVLDKPAFSFDKKINIKYLIDDKPNKEEFKKAIANKNITNILKQGFKSVKILTLKKIKNIEAINNIDSKYIITTRTFHNKLVSTYADENIVKIATEHNFHNNDNKYVNKLIKSINKFDYLVCVSQELQQFYQDKIGSTKCIFIPNVIDSLPDKSANLKENILINVGRLETEKGQLDLIDIVKKVKEKVNDVKLYLIGDGSLRHVLEEKVKDEDLEDTVIFTGFISKKEMEKYLTQAKLFVMTSFTESFGLVLIEAMSYKIPCIAFDSASGARFLLKDDVGILIENRDKQKMVDEIINSLSNHKKLNKLSSLSYEYCQKYLIKNVKKDWLKLLNDNKN